MKNRFILAPLTNKQSHDNGIVSDQELTWLTMRAKGQFGLVMTCAANVQANGKVWSGQLGIHSDTQLSGHRRLTENIKAYGSLAVIQLFHGGIRSPKEFIKGQAVGPSDNIELNARALSLTEIKELRNDFIAAALRAKKAGYDGVEIHAAYGYLLAQFLSNETNHRNDKYGGSLENRARLIFEIAAGIYKVCGADFLVGVRLSPEGYGMVLDEIKLVARQLIDSGKIHFLDMSLWDVFKKPEGHPDTNKSLLDHFLELDYKNVKLTVAGKINGGKEVREILNSGVDFVAIGRSGIIHHDFPLRVMKDDNFISKQLPVSIAHLKNEGLGPKFIEMMKSSWPDFIRN
ncbi:NADH:flavin oxidoreductase [Spongiimicrobium salis]|uniref:NADH:flavin oxidoreductase n=1 Tax=Spongiimicrobium salis TaxID=1667022 RepID=UPI00374CFEAF